MNNAISPKNRLTCTGQKREAEHAPQVRDCHHFNQYDEVVLKKDWRGEMKKGMAGTVVDVNFHEGKDYTVEFPKVCDWDIIPGTWLRLKTPENTKRAKLGNT